MSDIRAWLSPELVARGVDLSPWHVNEFALPLREAFMAAHELRARGLAILGGDGWSIGGVRPVPTDRRWHTDRRAGEPWTAFVDRGAAEAITALTRLFADAPDDERVVLVAIDEDRESRLRNGDE